MEDYWESSYSKLSQVEIRILEMKTLINAGRILDRYSELVQKKVQTIKANKVTA